MATSWRSSRQRPPGRHERRRWGSTARAAATWRGGELVAALNALDGADQRVRAHGADYFTQPVLLLNSTLAVVCMSLPLVCMPLPPLRSPASVLPPLRSQSSCCANASSAPRARAQRQPSAATARAGAQAGGPQAWDAAGGGGSRAEGTQHKRPEEEAPRRRASGGKRQRRVDRPHTTLVLI